MEIHGMTDTPEYATWIGMRKRCYYPKTNSYELYGGKGIQVCESWRFSFITFYKDMGPKPSSKHSIDRLDSDRDYAPENCRWATWKEQCESRLKANPPTPPLLLTCIECGEKFQRSVYAADRTGGKYCSISCASKVRCRIRDGDIHKRVLLACPVCGSSFYRTTYQIAHRKTLSCSIKCRDFHRWNSQHLDSQPAANTA